MDVTFFLTLDCDEARARRTRPRCPLNPNPLSTQDFDELLWPTNELYVREKVAPLEAKVIRLDSPRTVEDVQASVLSILRTVELGR